jgi:hypothetical protein
MQIMTPDQKRRCLRLAEFLEQLSPEYFNISSWGKKTDCGTVACAAGWATTIAEFNEEGFSGYDYTPVVEWLYEPKFLYEEEKGVETYRHSLGLDACQDFFGVGSIFTGDYYAYKHNNKEPKPRDVAEALRRAVASSPDKIE